MMTCKEMIEFLMEYVGGELPGDQAHSFEAHLRACPPCDRFLETYRASLSMAKKCCDEQDEMCKSMPEELIQAILKARDESKS